MNTVVCKIIIAIELVYVAAFAYGQEIRPYGHRQALEWYLPVNVQNRQSLENAQLTAIGDFGRLRKTRQDIPAHLHTGVDIKRPNPCFSDEPVFPAAEGIVISLRDDGPYAQIIIQHTLPNSEALWTVYEHISGIRVRLHEEVDPLRPIARFMNRDELKKYGRHFDHIHFEVMKVNPPPIKPDKERPFCLFGTYCLVCFTAADLDAKYYNPLEFLKRHWESY